MAWLTTLGHIAWGGACIGTGMVIGMVIGMLIPKK
jgi:ElaB/YqjD/DUF883 family membrane-anchored ribosome-binding protein